MNKTQLITIGVAVAIVGAIAYQKLSKALTYRLGAARIRIAGGNIVLEQEITFFLKAPGNWQFLDFEGDVFYKGQKVAVATVEPFTLSREGADTVIKSTIDPAGAGGLIAQVVNDPFQLAVIAREGFQVDGDAYIELAGKTRRIPIKTTVLP